MAERAAKPTERAKGKAPNSREQKKIIFSAFQNTGCEVNAGINFKLHDFGYRCVGFTGNVEDRVAYIRRIWALGKASDAASRAPRPAASKTNGTSSPPAGG